jgi:aminoglycoside/choline kinase family phosphotransferase
MKTFDYKESKFKTMTHSDLWTSQIMFALNEDGTPKRVKILDYQGLTLGHPALDIWSIIYSATDATYRADDMEEDLRAYFTILSAYMETQVNYTEFRQELEERRVMGMVMYGTFCMATLSPIALPSPVRPSKGNL